VSYWVDLSRGKGEFPRDPSLIHVNWMKWLGSRLNGNRAHDIQRVIVSHSWVTFYRECGTLCYHPISYRNQLVTGILSVSSVFVDK
jgi:hypothetical protein